MITLNFHGVRGSHPVADPEMMKYGGNTSCVELVKTNDQGMKVPIIIDAGSGLIKLGYELGKRLFSREYNPTFPMLFTHLHPDHIEGFNFFVPNFFPFVKIYIMGMEALKKDVSLILKLKAAPPIFPIEYKDFKSIREHRILSDGQVFFITQEGNPAKEAENPLFEIRVLQAYAPSHPQQGALYYKVTDPADGTSIACIWDIESHIGGDARVINFARNATVMIHDSQYTDEEYTSRKNPVQGFGHSTFSMAAQNAEAAGVKYLVPFHYNPRHTDTVLDGMEQKIQGKDPFEFIMSREGLSLSFDKGALVHRESFVSKFAPD